MITHTKKTRFALMVAFAVLVAIAVAACGKTSGESTSGESSATGASAKSESLATPLSEIDSGSKLTIGFSNYAAVIPFYQSMIAGVEDQAKKYGWSVDVTDSKFDPNTQVSDIQSLITRGVGLLVVSPGDQNALLPAYQEAARKHVPIISIGNKLAPSSEDYETAFFGVSNEKMGEIQTEALVQAINGEGSVYQAGAPPGLSFLREAEAGAKRVFEANPNVHVVFKNDTKEFSATDGLQFGQAALAAHPDVQGVWSAGEESGVGIVRAIEEAEVPGEVPVSIAGGSAQAMDLAAKGDIIGAILPTYTWGVQIMERIHGAIDGQEEFSGSSNAPMFQLNSAKQAKQLIAKCPNEPSQIWCLGR